MAAFRGTATVYRPASQDSTAWLPFESAVRFKKFSRAAAGRDRPSEGDVCAPPVLLEATERLVKVALGNRGHKEVVAFFLDRSRAIRQDLTLQTQCLENSESDNAAYLQIMRVLTRYLVYAGSCERCSSDEWKMIDDALLALLAPLVEIDENEFKQYYEWLFKHATSRRPSRALLLAEEGLYYHFFRHIKRLSELDQCAIRRRLLPEMQLKTIAVLNTALNTKMPLSMLCEIAHFESMGACDKTLQAVALDVAEDNGVLFTAMKKSNKIKVAEHLDSPLWQPLVNFVQYHVSDWTSLQAAIFRG